MLLAFSREASKEQRQSFKNMLLGQNEILGLHGVEDVMFCSGLLRHLDLY